jgi:peptidoglycan/LPS O-acetylase OafA/YrhL
LQYEYEKGFRQFFRSSYCFYSILLFLVAIKNPTVHINKAFEFIGDKLSLNVYIWHIIVARVISVFINHLGFAQNSIYLAIRPIFVVFFTLLLSLAIYRINNNIGSINNKNNKN